MASGTVYPNSDISIDWATSPGGPAYSILAGAFNPGYYCYAWNTNQSMILGFTLPDPGSGYGYSQLDLVFANDNGGYVLALLEDSAGGTLASAATNNGTASWVPAYPYSATDIAAVGPRMEFRAEGVSGNSAADPRCLMYGGYAYVNWTTAPLLGGPQMIL